MLYIMNYLESYYDIEKDMSKIILIPNPINKKMLLKLQTTTY